jgi:thiamine kinase-like enzyme
LVTNCNFDYRPCSILHGDATSGNLLGTFFISDSELNWKPTHLIDFGDAIIKGDPLFDISMLFITVFECNSSLLQEFLKLYGTMFEYLTWKQLVHKMLVYAVLCPSKVLVRELTKQLFLKKRVNCTSWEQVISILL